MLADRPRNRALAGGVIVPLGNNGLTLNLEATASRATPSPQANAVNFTSDFQRYSARLRYPVLRGRAASLYTELAFDAQDASFSAFNIGFEWGRQERSDRPNTGDRFTVTTLLRS